MDFVIPILRAQAFCAHITVQSFMGDPSPMHPGISLLFLHHWNKDWNQVLSGERFLALICCPR